MWVSLRGKSKFKRTTILEKAFGIVFLYVPYIINLNSPWDLLGSTIFKKRFLRVLKHDVAIPKRTCNFTKEVGKFS